VNNNQIKKSISPDFMRNWLKNKGKSTCQYIAHMLKGRGIANTQTFRASYLTNLLLSFKQAGKTDIFSFMLTDLRVFYNYTRYSFTDFEKFKEAPYGYIS
jgi:hypothetical protein